MAAYSYFHADKVATGAAWRRTLTRLVFSAAVAVTAFWAYAAVQQLRDAYSYILPSAQFGRWLSLALAALSLPAEGKVRMYLLLFALGLFLFFGCSIGELP